MKPVILINPFEVPEGREEECLAFWEKAAEYMRRQPGFISTRLHKSLSNEARFHFINVAEWESFDRFQAAVGSEEFREMTEPYSRIFPHYPGVYEVIRN